MISLFATMIIATSVREFVMVAPVDPSCPQIEMVTDNEMTLADREKAIEAERGCWVRYGKRAPCVKRLYRTGINDYGIICGGRYIRPLENGEE